MSGKFITFEGCDGSGKTSNIEVLAEHLRNRGYKVITTREPGGTPVAEKIRDIILQNHLEPRAELLLFAAARIEHVEKKIREHVARGYIVISDRFHDSTYAYQAGGRRMPKEMVLDMERLALGDFKPNYTLFFDIPLEESKRRLALREKSDRFDEASEQFRERVYNAYQERYAQNPDRMHRIDALPELAEVSAQVIAWANIHFENLN